MSPFNRTPNIEFAPVGDIDIVRQKLSDGDFAAVIIEGIQGVAGIRVVPDEFMQQLRQLTSELGVVIIVDEIQSGYGRSGKFFAHQYSGIRPDIITMAKGIANGFPMGALAIAPQFEPTKGMLGTTFGGNHLACAAALAVIDVIENENLIENAASVGAYLIDRLKEIDWLTDVRGRGLMVGFDIDGDAGALRKQLLFEKKIFTGGAGRHTVRLLPALNLQTQHIDHFINALTECLTTA